MDDGPDDSRIVEMCIRDRDSEGYMWYGTVNGLCRDDGYHVKVFRSDIETPGLLEDNFCLLYTSLLIRLYVIVFVVWDFNGKDVKYFLP